MAVSELGDAARHKDLAALADDDHTQYAIVLQNTFAARPAAGRAGRYYYATDTAAMFYDTGLVWELLPTQGAGVAYDSARLGGVAAALYSTTAQANAAYVAKADQVWQRIGEAVLAANGTIVFSAIPATFKHLALEVTGRGVHAAVVDNLVLRFNNDTRTIYDYQFVGGSASTPTAGEGINASFIELGRVAAATAPVGNVGAFRVEIPDYAATSFHKNVLCSSGYRFADGSGGVHSRQYYGTWRDTSAISRIDLLGQSGALAAGTIATLYGMKGA